MVRPLRVGVQLPEVEWQARWADLRELAVAAEGVGFDSIWVGDHLLYRTDAGISGPWEAWSLLAALAAATERVELGPLVAATAFHSPAMLAKKAATVDEISGGRLILGLGAGWNQVEFDAFGFPFDHRASRFEESFTIVRRLLAGETVDFEGTYHRVSGSVLAPPPRPGGPPLMIGSMGPRVLAATLPHVDMWNAWHAWYGNDAAGLQDLLIELDEHIVAAGRRPEDIAKTVAVMFQLPGGTGRRHGSPGRPSSVAITGSPEELASVLRQYAGLGIAHVQCVLDPITVESIEWMGQVLSALDSG